MDTLSLLSKISTTSFPGSLFSEGRQRRETQETLNGLMFIPFLDFEDLGS